MIWPYLRTGAPAATAWTAILWPRGMSCRASNGPCPFMSGRPARMALRTTATSSEGCSCRAKSFSRSWAMDVRSRLFGPPGQAGPARRPGRRGPSGGAALAPRLDLLAFADDGPRIRHHRVLQVQPRDHLDLGAEVPADLHLPVVNDLVLSNQGDQGSLGPDEEGVGRHEERLRLAVHPEGHLRVHARHEPAVGVRNAQLDEERPGRRV